MTQEYLKAVIKSSIMERQAEGGSVTSDSSHGSIEDDSKAVVSLQDTMNLRSPGVGRGRSVKEYEEQLGIIKKENFNLKLRIYFLEERMGTNFDLDKENIVKKNVELMVEIESLKKELQDKHELLCQAVKAMELEDEEHKKAVQLKEDQLNDFQQEIEDLRIQLQEVKFDTDATSSKSVHSDPAGYYSAQAFNLVDNNQSIVKDLQDKVKTLEQELFQEKENSASLQLILDQTENYKLKYENIQKECNAKEEKISALGEELEKYSEKLLKYEASLRELQAKLEEANMMCDDYSKKIEEKNRDIDDMLSQMNELRHKYTNCKFDMERERKRLERLKTTTDLKITELEEENEKQKSKIRDLQAKHEAALLEVKKNQNLAVSKSPTPNLNSSHTDVHSFSVTDSTTPSGTSQKDTLPVSLNSHVPSHSPVLSPLPISFDVCCVESFLRGEETNISKQLLDQLQFLKGEYENQKQKIVKLKAEQMKACKIIKGMIDSRTKCINENKDLKIQIEKLSKEMEGMVPKNLEVMKCTDGTSSKLSATISEVDITSSNPSEKENWSFILAELLEKPLTMTSTKFFRPFQKHP